jgi:hypothetical protein
MLGFGDEIQCAVAIVADLDRRAFGIGVNDGAGCPASVVIESERQRREPESRRGRWIGPKPVSARRSQA